MYPRPLSAGERDLLLRVTDVPWPRAKDLHASVPYLVVTGGCGCGCASFFLEDERFSPQGTETEHWCNAAAADGDAGVAVWLGADGRLFSVDVEDGLLSDPAGLAVELPGA